MTKIKLRTQKGSKAVTALARKAQRKLPAQTVTKLAGHATRIRAALRRSLLEVGHELTEAKALITHGQFTVWVERETGMTARTAQLILGAYRLCLKHEKFSLLGRSALFILGAADVPANAIVAVERQIAAGNVPRYTDVRDIVRKGHLDQPSAVSVALRMEHEPAKAMVIDLGVHRALAQAEAAIAEYQQDHERQQSVQDFRDGIKVADIAVMLSDSLDSGQVFRLVTMIRNAPSDATLTTLADALEAI
jgi:hypothetical protein